MVLKWMFSWIFKHKKLYKPISSDFFSKSFNEQQSFIFIKSCKVKFFYILTFFFSRRQVPNNFLLLRAFFKLFNLELCSFFVFSLLCLSFSFCSCLSLSLEIKVIWKGYEEEPLLRVSLLIFSLTSKTGSKQLTGNNFALIHQILLDGF